MIDAKVSTNTEQAETRRRADLERLEILDSLPEPLFDDITRLAALICNTPIALISLVDDKRQWFKSRLGLDATETARELAFCAHAIRDPDHVMVVPDATADPRFVDNGLVTSAPNIRFYAGAPIITAAGTAIGTVCVIDRTTRELSDEQIDALRVLSRLVSNMLESRKSVLASARAATEAAQARTRIIQEVTVQSPDLKAFIDSDYRWQFVNDTYLNYWGTAREEIEGKLMIDVLGEEVFYQVVKPQLDAAFAGNTVSYERTFRFPERGPTPVEVIYAPVYDHTRTVIGAVARATDISERKAREQELHATANALQEKSVAEQRFIHIVSHDLKEPLNAIINFSSLLEQQLSGHSAQTDHYLERVTKGGRRLASLLDQLSRFVQLQGASLNIAEVDLDELMRSIAEDLHVRLVKSGGKLEWGALPTVQGDGALLQVAIRNLVSNGLKFARQGVPPVVNVSALLSDHELSISVEDNGMGIPSDQFANIFEVFRRLNSRKAFEGNGLGLANCRRIAELHGGRIEVTSELGQGSRFSLILPR